jgi:hypothetical protein
MTRTEVFVIGAVRTAIGRFGGTLNCASKLHQVVRDDHGSLVRAPDRLRITPFILRKRPRDDVCQNQHLNPRGASHPTHFLRRRMLRPHVIHQSLALAGK